MDRYYNCSVGRFSFKTYVKIETRANNDDFSDFLQYRFYKMLNKIYKILTSTNYLHTFQKI